MDWPTVLLGIQDTLASELGRAEKAVRVASLIRQAGNYRWVGLYVWPINRSRPLAGADQGRLLTHAFR
jgi:hypothetical protein